jgi:hypothetical protein
MPGYRSGGELASRDGCTKRSRLGPLGEAAASAPVGRGIGSLVDQAKVGLGPSFEDFRNYLSKGGDSLAQISHPPLRPQATAPRRRLLRLAHQAPRVCRAARILSVSTALRGSCGKVEVPLRGVRFVEAFALSPPPSERRVFRCRAPLRRPPSPLFT